MKCFHASGICDCCDAPPEQEPPPCKECGGPTVFYDDTPSRRLFKCEACSTPENYRWTTVPRDEQEPR